MKKPLVFTFIAAAITLSIFLVTKCKEIQPAGIENQESVLSLPTPFYNSTTSVEKALLERRSVRSYGDDPLTPAEVSQLLWAAQGITNEREQRTAPSAGALYPLELYLLAGAVIDLPTGIYHYKPDNHELELVVAGDHQLAMYEAGLSQSAIEDAAAIIVITAIYERTTVKYGQRGIQYVHMEVGNVAQNIYLQAVSLDLGTVFIGAFHDDQIQNILHLNEDEIPFGIMPVGRK